MSRDLLEILIEGADGPVFLQRKPLYQTGEGVSKKTCSKSRVEFFNRLLATI